MYENNQNKRPRGSRIKGKGLAVVTCTPEAQFFEYDPYIRRQVSRTLGMMRDFGHPDVEVLYKFSDQPYDHPLLSLIHSNVSKGIRYKAGDRLAFQAGAWKEEYTVEFRDITAEEQLLRAVVLELDTEYQALPTDQAAAAVMALYEQEQLLCEETEKGDDEH